MKKIYLTALLFCYGTISCISQNNLIGTETWEINDLGILQPVEKESFEYDQSGNRIFQSRSYWSETFLENDLFNAWDIFSEERKAYNSSNQVTSCVYENLGGSSGYRREETYVYNDNCTELKNEKIYYHDVFFYENISYYNAVTCEIDSIEMFWVDQGIPYQQYLELFYYNGNDELRILFNQDSLGGFTHELFYYETTRNDMGLITRAYQSFTDIGPELFLAEYDQYGNFIYKANYTVDHSNLDSLKIYKESFYDHSYNATVQLIETSLTDIFYDIGPNGETETYTSSFIYDYYCDGYLNTLTATVDAGPTTVKFYQYQTGHDCTLPEAEDLLTIRPNFTQGHILIKSEILQTANSYISLYDMSGRRLVHLKTNRIQHYYLDIGDLPAGSYVLHVFNGEYSETERVVKM